MTQDECEEFTVLQNFQKRFQCCYEINPNAPHLIALCADSMRANSLKMPKKPNKTAINDNVAMAPAPRTPRPAPSLLLTGFEPFGDDPSGLGLNPSAQIAQALHGERIGTHRVVGSVLPCEYERSFKTLQSLIKTHQPQWIVCLGQAGGRHAISLERVAINLDDAAQPDNAGLVRSGSPISARGRAAYFSTLPIPSMLAALQREGLACELSSTAGHFVCNHVFYRLMASLARQSARRGGFIHVPYLPEQAPPGQPSMTLAQMTQGIRTALTAALASALIKP
jgi:pyroglutamyl-peptidase